MKSHPSYKTLAIASLYLLVFLVGVASVFAAYPGNTDVDVVASGEAYTNPQDDANNASQAGDQNLLDVNSLVGGATGQNGEAYDFEASDGADNKVRDCIEFQNVNYTLNSSGMTTCAWVMQESDYAANAYLWSGGGMGTTAGAQGSHTLSYDGPNDHFGIWSANGASATEYTVSHTLGIEEWNHVCLTTTTNANGVHKIFVNGTYIGGAFPSKTTTQGDAFSIGCYLDGAFERNAWDGEIDENYWFEGVLPNSTISSLADGTAGSFYPWGAGGGSDPVVTILAPANNSHHNEGNITVNFNATEPDSNANLNITLWVKFGAGSWTANQTLTDQEGQDLNMTDTFTEGAWEFKVEATESDGASTNSTAVNYVIDQTNPVVNLVGKDIVVANTSIIHYHFPNAKNDSIEIDLQASDTYMFAFNVTIIGDTTGKIYSNQTTGLGGAVFDSNNTLNLSSYPAQVFRIHVNASDDHTANWIPDYGYETTSNSLTFDTPEGVTCSIEASEGNLKGLEVNKSNDRYSWTFVKNNAKTEHAVDVICNYDMHYRGSLYEYPTFVMGPGLGTNWIDFNLGPGVSYNVNQHNSKHYTITATLPEASDSVTYQSIGGLNIINQEVANFEWNKTPINPSLLTINEVGSTQMNLSWPAGTGASFYEVRNTTDGILNTTLLNVNVTGLTPATLYTFYVNSIYNDSGTYYQNFSLLTSASQTTTSNTSITFLFYNGTQQGFKIPEATNYLFTWIVTQVNESGAWSNVNVNSISQATSNFCNGTAICKVTLTFNNYQNISGLQVWEWYHTYTAFTTELWVMEDMNSAFSFAILDDLGTPLENAYVELYQYGGQESLKSGVNKTDTILVGSRYTNDAGTATFYLNTSRSYAYEISKAGYSVARASFRGDEYVNNTASPFEIRLQKTFTIGDAQRIIYVPRQLPLNGVAVDFWIKDIFTNTSYTFNTSFSGTEYSTAKSYGYFTGELVNGTHYTDANLTLWIYHGGTLLGEWNLTYSQELFGLSGQTDPLADLQQYSDTWLTPLLFVLLIIISIGVGSYFNTETGTAGFTTFMVGLVIISIINYTQHWWLAIIPGLYFVGSKFMGVLDDA